MARFVDEILGLKGNYGPTARGEDLRWFATPKDTTWVRGGSQKYWYSCEEVPPGSFRTTEVPQGAFGESFDVSTEGVVVSPVSGPRRGQIRTWADRRSPSRVPESHGGDG